MAGGGGGIGAGGGAAITGGGATGGGAAPGGRNATLSSVPGPSGFGALARETGLRAGCGGWSSIVTTSPLCVKEYVRRPY